MINTHLHDDHCSGNVFFNKARFIEEHKELRYWKNPFRVHKQAYAIGLPKTAFELTDEDAEIAPGVQVILTPGHSPGSQAVIIGTCEGLAIIVGDSIPHFENMVVRGNEPFWSNGIYVDSQKYYESLNRLKDLGDGGFTLPGHDSLVREGRYAPSLERMGKQCRGINTNNIERG